MQMNEMKFFEGVPVDGYGPGFFASRGRWCKGRSVWGQQACAHGRAMTILTR